MKKQKQNRKPALVLLVCACVFAVFYFALTLKNCSGSDRQNQDKWSGVNADDSYVTGGTAENTQSVAESENFTAEPTPKSADAEADAPSEGLSQVVYEQLEQPAPIEKNPEVLLFKSAFIVSYNLTTSCPNYVAWHLTDARTKGGAKRGDYIEDMVLGESSRVLPSDFSRSGYDRGHMCPAGDNKNSEQAMAESFMMTNICPQDHDLNGGWWNDLEIRCREWANKGADLYIVCGPIFDTPSPKKIGNRKNLRVSVPDRFFKVILMMGDAPKAIGFIVPNLDLNEPISKFAVPVDRVEKITGLDFYPNLPDGLERKVERDCQPAAWGL